MADDLVKRLRSRRHWSAVHSRYDADDMSMEAADRIEALSAENARLREAFEKSDKRQVWQDGFDAAKAMVLSFRCHATWGPKATPNDGIKLALDGVKGIFDRAAARCALKETGA